MKACLPQPFAFAAAVADQQVEYKGWLFDGSCTWSLLHALHAFKGGLRGSFWKPGKVIAEETEPPPPPPPPPPPSAWKPSTTPPPSATATTPV